MNRKIKSSKNIPITGIILECISIFDVAYRSMLPKEILRSLQSYTDNRYNKRKVQSILSKMKIRGYIEIKCNKEKFFIVMTEKGISKLLSFKAQKIAKKKKPRHWDGKWRVVIFDISEKQRKVRSKLRMELKQIGFVLLQRSVWVYPYRCEEYITLLALDERVGRNVIYMEVEYIAQDKALRKHFKLK